MVATHDTRGSAINLWVYFLGEVTGEDIKVGHSTGGTLAKRVATVNQGQTTNARYQVLAGLRGDTKDETFCKKYFSEYVRTDKGTKTEYFWPSPALAEYVNWLRQWWWVSITDDEKISELDSVPADLWLPNPARILPPPPDEPGKLIQSYVALDGPLAGTPWAWMVSPRQSIQDYFTPIEIVDAARMAMGGIDLDAASHPIANRVLKIPDYFHINRSAFEHNWHGRVWLNPPYGHNAPWFERILKFFDSGEMTQLCMLSPVWSFTTQQARPVMERSSATVLLSPTPKFWGNAAGKTGANHPHAVVYLGPRISEFFDAFASFGIPVEMAWNRLGEFVPAQEAAA